MTDVKDIEYDYSELFGLIKTHFGSQEKFAEALGISKMSLTNRLLNRLQFKQNEIEIARKLFNLSAEDVLRIFLQRKLRKLCNLYRWA